jgi:dihydrolipoamide dehydrogenase
MQDTEHLSALGVEVDADNVSFSREGIAAHAKNLANRVKGNLEASLVGLGVDVIDGRGILTGNPHEVKDGITGKVYTAKVRVVAIVVVAIAIVASITTSIPMSNSMLLIATRASVYTVLYTNA